MSSLHVPYLWVLYRRWRCSFHGPYVCRCVRVTLRRDVRFRGRVTDKSPPVGQIQVSHLPEISLVSRPGYVTVSLRTIDTTRVPNDFGRAYSYHG